MPALIEKIERKEIVVIERPTIESTMGGAFAYAKDTTLDEFLNSLKKSFEEVKRMGGMIPGDIQIITDGNGNFAATMKMGY